MNSTPELATSDAADKAVHLTTPHEAAPDEQTLKAWWMPFTANRQFKRAPRLLVQAKGMHYVDQRRRRILDAVAGLWCVNAGHGREAIATAIAQQARELDYAPPFQMGHPAAFALARRLAALAPAPLGHVFFTNSGSEAVETALKMALAYHRARGEGQRTRLIGRERGYHGVNFGGISVGGMVANRRAFGPLLPGVDHIRHTHDLARNAYSVGQPLHGVELADDLERLISLHDASTIAAVIIEPIAGSTGVLVPPVGYLQRLRDICTRHGILLIFDEVITGFGRTGQPFAAQTFGVTPDLMTLAKGLTNGTVPMGAVLAASQVHDALMQGPEQAIEFFHGYTYSAHPLACAAAEATLDVYAEEGLLTRAEQLAGLWAQGLHSLRGEPNVIDIRSYGLVGAVELAPHADGPTLRAMDVFLHCFEHGKLLVRTTGDTVALSPPLIVEPEQIDEVVAGLRAALRAVA
jgi:beta-alanine--pyruvate transaminase